MLCGMKHLRIRNRQVLLVPVMLCAVLSGPVNSQQAGPGSGVTVDFVAVTASGEPITDLKASDITVRIGGRDRNVTNLELRRASGAGDAAAAPAAPAVPPPYSTNQGGGSSASSAGRRILIVVDNESLRAGTERDIRASLEPVFKALGPGDRVAFASVPNDIFGVGLGSAAAAQAALEKFTGGRAASHTDDEARCRTRDALTALRRVVESAPRADQPATVIFFSQGITSPGTTSSGSGCQVTPDLYQGVGQALAIARANLFVVQGDPSFAATSERTRNEQQGLESLAALGGGNMLRATPTGLSRLPAESAAYYVATVAPESNDRPSVVRLEVRSKREGVTIRSRSEISLGGRATGPAGAAAPAGAGQKPASVNEMVTTTAPFTALPLRTTAIASRGQADKMAVFTMTEPIEPGVKLTALRAVLFDPATSKSAFVADANAQQLAARTVSLPMAVAPGRYRLRVAATDDKGRAGAVDHEVDTTLVPAGALKLGGLMLLSPRGESFSPVMEFANEPEIGVYAEMYGQLTAQVEARIELAQTVDGPAIDKAQVGGSQSNEPDKFILNGKLPIAKLAPGDYVVRMVVKMGDAPEGRLVRTLRKTGK
jgi:hypothetical protein